MSETRTLWTYFLALWCSYQLSHFWFLFRSLLDRWSNILHCWLRFYSGHGWALQTRTSISVYLALKARLILQMAMNSNALLLLVHGQIRTSIELDTKVVDKYTFIFYFKDAWNVGEYCWNILARIVRLGCLLLSQEVGARSHFLICIQKTWWFEKWKYSSVNVLQGIFYADFKHKANVNSTLNVQLMAWCNWNISGFLFNKIVDTFTDILQSYEVKNKY